MDKDSLMTEHKYPPGIFVVTRDTKLVNKLSGGKNAKDFEDIDYNQLILTPDRRWLKLISEEMVQQSLRRLKNFQNSKQSWIGITTIGNAVFRIGNKMMKPSHLLNQLKRQLFLFDQIAIYDLIPSLFLIPDKTIVKKILRLCEEKIICQPEVDDEEISVINEEYQSLYKNSCKEFVTGVMAIGAAINYLSAQKTFLDNIILPKIFAEIMDNLIWWETRAASLWFQNIEGVRVIPILKNPPKSPLIFRPEIMKSIPRNIRSWFHERNSQKEEIHPTADIIQIILNKMPMPNDETHWEDIIAFKKDPETRLHLLAIRNWANEIARLKLNPSEIEDKLEWLIENYKTHSKLHKIKFQIGKVELFLTTSTSVLQELARFNFGNATKLLFQLKRRNVELSKAEIETPGLEVAYIIKSEQEFSG